MGIESRSHLLISKTGISKTKHFQVAWNASLVSRLYLQNFSMLGSVSKKSRLW
jgi:hypothetical protein